MTDLRIGLVVRVLAAALALLGALSLVGEGVLMTDDTSIGVLTLLRWGATLFGIWILGRAAWTGRLQLGGKDARR